jgi:hypothetical protein
MGILSRLLGSSGDEPEPEPEPSTEREHIPLTRYFFIGQTMDDPIDDAVVILQESADEPSWSIARCNEPLRVPDDRDSSICVYRRGSIIARNEAAFQAHYAWLLSASEREALDDESRSEIVDRLPFPERLRGHDIPAASSIEREQLEQLYLSLSLDV